MEKYAFVLLIRRFNSEKILSQILMKRFVCWNLGKLIPKLAWKCKKPRINTLQDTGAAVPDLGAS